MADPSELDGLVANAGGGGALAPLHLQDVDEYRRVLELDVIVNVDGLTDPVSVP